MLEVIGLSFAVATHAAGGLTPTRPPLHPPHPAPPATSRLCRELYEIHPAEPDFQRMNIRRIFELHLYAGAIDTHEARELLARNEGSSAPWPRALEMRYQDHFAPRDIATRRGTEVPRVYEMLRKAKHEYRVALFGVMATYYPEAGEAELEQRCIELLSYLKVRTKAAGRCKEQTEPHESQGSGQPRRHSRRVP